MQLLVADIDRVKPYEANPRTITEDDISKLVAVIEAQGFLDPVEVDASWEIVAGHRRYLAARKLNLARIPVVLHEGMTKEEARIYRISSNKLSEDVKWNRELLSNEMLAIEHLIASPSDVGFDDKELAKLFDLDMADKTDEELEAMGDKKEPGPYIARGQVWRIGPVTFEVYKNLNDDQLRNAEKAIIKIQKLVKHEAMLDDMTLKDYLAEKQREEMLS